jgi:hypothetical protein
MDMWLNNNELIKNNEYMDMWLKIIENFPIKIIIELFENILIWICG